ncbi:MAG: type VI secretion system accessory protein TagJ [Planctomycetota bacterium]
MSVDALIREGRLQEALAQQTQHVKSHPGDPDARYVLFCLLAFDGQLERSLLQLDVLGHGDQQLGMGSLVYRNLLASEEERRRVFEERAKPVFPPDPPSWLEDRLAALHAASVGAMDAACARLEELGDKGTLVAGRSGGEAFTAIRDGDDLLGPVLEVHAGGRYLWMPFERIRSLKVSKPENLADLIWVPAQLVDTEGDSADVHLPVVYAGSARAESEAARLGGETHFSDDDGVSRGIGQKVFWTVRGEAIEETPILELGNLELGPA